MVVDTSALVAILLKEKERDRFVDLILSSPAVVVSAASIVETSIVFMAKRAIAEEALLDTLLAELRIDIRSAGGPQIAAAREAHRRFGKGRHRAALNFGDCFSYALAKVRNDMLLFKGDDFARTDIVAAWRP